MRCRDGELHAIAGDGLSSAEKYDPRTDSWSVVPAMELPEAEQGGGVAVLMV